MGHCYNFTLSSHRHIQVNEYKSEGAAREWSTVVLISITSPSFKSISLPFLRSPLSKTPKQVFFNPINIFDIFYTLCSTIINLFIRLTSKFIFTVLLTVSRAAPVFLSFLIFFFCILIGFALLANNVLGMYVPAFRTFLGTLSTLMQTASGEVDLRGAPELSPMPAYAYVIMFSYTFVVKLVVLNCAIAIVTFVYSRTMGARQKQILREEIENAPSVYYNLSFWQFMELITRGAISSTNLDNALAGMKNKKKKSDE